MSRRSDLRLREKKKQAKAARAIKRLGVFLLLDAQNPSEEFTAIMVLLLARRKGRESRSRRYGRRGTYTAPKIDALLHHIMYDATDRFFKAFMRMDRENFWDLDDLIRYHPVFQSKGRKPQRPSHIQLAAFLCYVGGESGIKTAAFTAIAEGTVWTYIARSVTAIRSFRNFFIQWPDGARRDGISEGMGKNWPGCIGSCDGTYIPSALKPLINGFAFWCHKGFYAYVLQATCDHRGLITSYDYAWPGSVQDSRVFRLSHLWQHRAEYFRDHEYILVDKGYPLTNYSIRPFHDQDFTQDEAEKSRRKEWNRQLSKRRVKIEHVFGRLKGRFPYLRRVPGTDVEVVYRTIEALLVVHNFLEGRRDNPETIPEYNPEDEPDREEVLQDAFGAGNDRVNYGDNELHAMGVYRRKELVALMERNVRREAEGTDSDND